MEYRIIRSDRRTVSISINESCEIIVRAPKRLSELKIKLFVESNSEWIIQAIERQSKANEKKLSLDNNQIKKLKTAAKVILKEKIDYYSDLMGVEYTGFKITSAQKRFGSCNERNSICFSYLLLLYPEEAIDYVVVHELAHIKHHNHSKCFYDTVMEIFPDYKYRENLLKSHQKLPNFM